jgi:hypothetical protein
MGACCPRRHRAYIAVWAMAIVQSPAGSPASGVLSQAAPRYAAVATVPQIASRIVGPWVHRAAAEPPLCLPW